MINVETVMQERFPTLVATQSLWFKGMLRLLRLLCHEREFRQFEQDYPHLEGFDFIEQVLRYFEFGYKVLDHEKERIPAEGRLVIVANHPIGSLDGLALLKLVGTVRRDVKVVANDLLYNIKPLRPQLLPVDNMGGKTRKENLKAIRHYLEQEGAVIFFPAGEVSRIGPQGVRDGNWHAGFLRYAQASKAPILPMFVDGRNSVFFYALSLLAKPISTLWLIREMFKQAKQYVDVRVGQVITHEHYQHVAPSLPLKSKLFKKHVYRLGKGKVHRRFSADYVSVAHPENRQALRQEIRQCEHLGETGDGKQIYVYSFKSDSVIMREIGRLREYTFRKVNEGTGFHRDVDAYDRYYDHLVLWDEQDLEIVGAYRLIRSAKLLDDNEAVDHLYTQTLFNYKALFTDYLKQGLELGRSFVQPRYWGKRSLDYLWYGIGAYLNKYPEIRYLYGPVSISGAYPVEAKRQLIAFYCHFFPAKHTLLTAKNPYFVPYGEDEPPFSPDSDYLESFRLLKKSLCDMGVSVPTLYKQYTELCEDGGVQFAAFNIDPDFSDCIDGLIIVDLEQVKASKRARYMGEA